MVATIVIPIITVTVILNTVKYNLLRKSPLLSHWQGSHLLSQAEGKFPMRERSKVDRKFQENGLK